MENAWKGAILAQLKALEIYDVRYEDDVNACDAITALINKKIALTTDPNLNEDIKIALEKEYARGMREVLMALQGLCPPK